jgi:hypothetical protein
MVGCSTVGGFAVVRRFCDGGGQLTAHPASIAAQLLLLTSATSLLLLPLLLLLQEAPSDAGDAARRAEVVLHLVADAQLRSVAVDSQDV